MAYTLSEIQPQVTDDGKRAVFFKIVTTAGTANVIDYKAFGLGTVERIEQIVAVPALGDGGLAARYGPIDGGFSTAVQWSVIANDGTAHDITITSPGGGATGYFRVVGQ